MCQKLIALTLSLALLSPAPSSPTDATATPPEYDLPAPDLFVLELVEFTPTPTPAPTPEPVLPTEVPPAPLPTQVPTAPPPPTAAQIIERAARWWGLSPRVLLAIAWCESSHRPWVDSAAGQRGLFQFERPTWEEQAPRYGLSPHFSVAYDAWSNAYLAAALMANGEWSRWANCL